MGTARRIVRGTFILLIILVIGGGVAGYFYSRTQSFNNRVKDKVIAALTPMASGKVTVGKLEGSIWSGITLEEVALWYRNAPIVAIPKLSVSYSIWSFITAKTIAITALKLSAPAVSLVQHPDGQWNIIEALPGLRQPAAGGAPSYQLVLKQLLISGGVISVTQISPQPRTYLISAVNLDSYIKQDSAGLIAEVRQLKFVASAGNAPPVHADLKLKYDAVSRPALVTVEQALLSAGQSRLKLAGTVKDLKRPSIDARLDVYRIAPADMQTILASWPLKRDLNGVILVSGPQTSLHLGLALGSGPARVRGKLVAALADKKTVDGSVELSNLDLQPVLDLKQVSGVADVTVRLRDSGLTLSSLAAHIEGKVRQSIYSHYQIGSLNLVADVSQQNARLDLKVAGDYGSARLSGQTSLSATPAYRLALQAHHLDLRDLTSRVRSNLNLTAQVEGRGFKPLEMDVITSLKVQPSNIGAVEIERAALDGRLAGGLLSLTRASVIAQGASLKAAGSFGVAGGRRGELSYEVRSADIGPLLNLAKRSGSGALVLSGNLRGTLAELSSKGGIAIAKLRVAAPASATQLSARAPAAPARGQPPAYAIGTGRLIFDLAGVGAGIPRGTVTAALSGVRAGIALRTFAAEVRIPAAVPQQIQIVASAQNLRSQPSAVRLIVVRSGAETRAFISTLSLGLPGGVWALQNPATVATNQFGVAVKNFALVNNSQQITLEGTLATAAAQNMSLRISDLNLADLAPLAPALSRLNGRLTAAIAVQGTGAAPQITATAGLRGLMVEGQRYDGLTAGAAYRPGMATVNLLFTQDAAHTLSAGAKLPMQLSWANGFSSQSPTRIDAKISSQGLNIALLNAFAADYVAGTRGSLIVDATVRGPLNALDAQGQVRLVDAGLKVLPLNVSVKNLVLEVDLVRDSARIVKLSAQSGEGSISGQGSIALANYRPGAASAFIRFDNWPAIDTEEYAATVSGQVTVAGALSALTLGGAIDVADATLRPPLTFAGGVAIKPDPTIMVVRANQVPALQAAPPAAPPPTLYQAMAIDLGVSVGRDTWIREPDAQVNLTGYLRIVKRPNAALTVIGSLQTLRGNFTFQGKTFTLQQGNISFTGGNQIAPTLDITAQYKVTQYLVFIHIAGNSSKPRLELSSQPQLEQADVLAVILFGRPVQALNHGQQSTLQQNAIGLAGSFAASQLANSVSQALGLEGLGVGLSGSQVTFGQYVSEDIYVSASSQFYQQGGAKTSSQAQGSTASVEYYLTPEVSVTTSVGTKIGNQVDLSYHKKY